MNQILSLILNKPMDTITSVDCTQFKQVMLALLYDMSSNQVSKKLSKTKTNTEQMMNELFPRFQNGSRCGWTKAYARGNCTPRPLPAKMLLRYDETEPGRKTGE